MYNVYDWYWRADDGRVFASARQVTVDETDADYVAWIENNVATQWPRDDQRNQTDAALQEVLQPYNIFANLKYYTHFKRWVKEQGGITLSLGWPIKTDDRAQGKINGMRLAAMANATQSTNWLAADGTYHTVSDPEMITISNELQLHIDNCFNISKDVDAQIDAGTITTHAQIDAAFA